MNSNQKEDNNKKKKILKEKEIFDKLCLFKKQVMENNDLELRDESLSKEIEEGGKIKKIISKNLKNVKDGFEYATNWERVFVDLYRHLEWLSSYADQNVLAMEKILKKFSKEFFQNKDNYLKADILDFIESK